MEVYVLSSEIGGAFAVIKDLDKLDYIINDYFGDFKILKSKEYPSISDLCMSLEIKVRGYDDEWEDEIIDVTRFRVI